MRGPGWGFAGPRPEASSLSDGSGSGGSGETELDRTATDMETTLPCDLCSTTDVTSGEAAAAAAAAATDAFEILEHMSRGGKGKGGPPSPNPLWAASVGPPGMGLTDTLDSVSTGSTPPDTGRRRSSDKDKPRRWSDSSANSDRSSPTTTDYHRRAVPRKRMSATEAMEDEIAATREAKSTGVTVSAWWAWCLGEFTGSFRMIGVVRLISLSAPCILGGEA
jgi:hypothetical protein